VILIFFVTDNNDADFKDMKKLIIKMYPLIYFIYLGLGVRVMVFNGTFNNISVISWWSVYWWRKLEYLEKTTDLTQVTDKQLS
jgi:hypothetical protein